MRNTVRKTSPKTSIADLFDIQLKRQQKHRLAILHLIEQGRESERTANIFRKRSDHCLLRLIDLSIGRALITEKRFEKRTRFWEDDAFYVFVGGQIRKLFGDLDGFFKTAEFIDKPVGFRLRPGPDASLAEVFTSSTVFPALGDLRRKLPK